MHESLDIYDIGFIPREMKAYLRNYGYSFNKKACECAVRLMKRKNPTTDKIEPLEAWDKEKVEELLTKHGIKLERNVGWNFVYVCNMALADFYKKSIPDEQHLAMYVKDVIDDVDANKGNVFRKWLACMDGNGEPIEWDELI